jgi:hypothetical protein
MNRDRAATGGASWRFVIRLEAVVLAGAVLVALAWDWRHPDVLRSDINGLEVHDRPGATALIGMTTDSFSAEPEAVTLHSVNPRIASLPRGATVDVKVCRGPSGEIQVLSSRGPLSDRCAHVDGVAGAVLNLADRTADQVVLVVHSTGRQRVRINGVDVLYSAGWRRGHQTVGPTVVVDFSGQDQIDAVSMS